MDDTKPLDEAHCQVDARAHVVRGKSAHKGVEFGRGRADAKEKRNFDENDKERARAADLVGFLRIESGELTGKELQKGS